MENFTNSSNNSSDFEFKYIPKKEFERIMKKVEQERKQKSVGIWGGFCSVTSAKDDDKELIGDSIKQSKLQAASKAINDGEIQSIIESFHKKNNNTPVSAPFFGSSVKLGKRKTIHVGRAGDKVVGNIPDVQMLAKKQEKSKYLSAKSGSSSSSTLSFHIMDEVYEEPQETAVKIQVSTTQIEDENASGGSSVDEDSSLRDEMMRLCDEITNANRTKESDVEDSSVDLTCQDEQFFRGITEKSEEKFTGASYSKLIDKKFDFLFDECKSFAGDGDEDEAKAKAAQTLPVVELKTKSAGSTKQTPDDDATNDNNVWSPKAENQIRKSDGLQESEKSGAKKKQHRDDVFPSDVIIRKDRDVGKLKRYVNEKSQVADKSQSTNVDERLAVGNMRTEPATSSNDVLNVLSRVTHYQKKICQYLDYLLEIIEDPPEIEDVTDLKRRQKRANEFSNRFARNHLYQIGRVAEEVRLMPDNPLDIATKVNFLFQVMMQAIQSYLKTVEMFIYNNCPEKLLVLVDFIINAVKICFDRMVFDKRDSTIRLMLRKCSDMKQYLLMNQQSLAKFSSISEKRRKSLSSRNTFAYEVPQDTKLMMYGAPTQKQKVSKRHVNLLKSPYDGPTIKIPVTSHSKISANSKAGPTSRSSVRNRVKSPMLKRSLSNVSTMVQRMKNVESKETVAEKPLEEAAAATAVQKPKEEEFAEMLQKIAQEKIHEMLAPFIDMMRKKDLSNFQPEVPKEKEMPRPTSKPKSPAPRVTSDVAPRLSTSNPKVTTPEKQKVESPSSPATNSKNVEKIQRISKNVQYIYVKSDAEDSQPVQSSPKLSISKVNMTSSEVNCAAIKAAASKFKSVALKSKPPIPYEKESKDEKFMKKFKDQAMKERMHYLEQMSDNPMYVNEACDEPWKMVGRISDKLLDEMLQGVIAELDFGEKSFVDSFLRHELEC